MRRGRPRHDDTLTPREWEVLALLREGLSNQAIASRLGISNDTAKYHVSEILGKLGVSSREEAACWQGRPRRGWVWAPLDMRVFLPAATVGLVSIAIITLVLLIVLSDGSDEGGNELLGLPGEAQADIPPTPSATLESRPQVGDPAAIELTVCVDDYEWTRPSLEEQAAHVDADMRYAPFGEIAQSQFEASFYIGAGPATGRGNLLGKMVVFSGLWSRGDGRELQAELNIRCPIAPNMFTHPERIDLFLFGYGATAAHWDGEGTIITVETREAGFQAVQLRYPDPASDYSGPFIFVDAEGKTIGVIGDNGFWSTPP